MKRITMRQLTLEMNKIVKKYLTACIRERLDIAKAKQLGETLFDKTPNRLYIEAFEIALNSLPDSYRTIINNDFLSQNMYFWWEQNYSRSTYYRHKYEALYRFLALIANI